MIVETTKIDMEIYDIIEKAGLTAREAVGVLENVKLAIAIAWAKEFEANDKSKGDKT